MNRDNQRNGDREAYSRSPTRQIDEDAVQAAAETMHKVAEISRRLKGVSSVIENMVQVASGRSDLTLAHWLIVVYLARGDARKQGELNLETGMAAGYLTRLLDELDAKGMISRRRSTEDRRQILLSLTDAGRNAAMTLLVAIDRHRLPVALDGLKSSLDSFISN